MDMTKTEIKIHKAVEADSEKLWVLINYLLMPLSIAKAKNST